MKLLQARDICVRVDSNDLLKDINLDLSAGEVVGLIGPNGAGKTTLLRALAKLLEPSAGAVLMNEVALAQIGAADFAKRCAYLAQGAAAHWPLSVERVVALGRIPHLDWRQSLSAQDRDAIERAMNAAEIIHLRERAVTTLSGGERMRVLLARVFAAQPQIILADEPIAALDPYHQLHVMELLREHAHAHDKKNAVLVVLHDLNCAAQYCDRVVLMANAQIVCSGVPRDVLTPENVRAVYGVDIRVTADDDHFSLALIGRHQF